MVWAFFALARATADRGFPNAIECNQLSAGYADTFCFRLVGLKYLMLRNSASGPEIGLPGRISTGFSPGEPQNRPSGRRADFDVFPIRVRPGSPFSGPEALLRKMGYDTALNCHYRSASSYFCMWSPFQALRVGSGATFLPNIVQQPENHIFTHRSGGLAGILCFYLPSMQRPGKTDGTGSRGNRPGGPEDQEKPRRHRKTV